MRSELKINESLIVGCLLLMMTHVLCINGCGVFPRGEEREKEMGKYRKRWR
jgi:hypothetical protein